MIQLRLFALLIILVGVFWMGVGLMIVFFPSQFVDVVTGVALTQGLANVVAGAAVMLLGGCVLITAALQGSSRPQQP